MQRNRLHKRDHLEMLSKHKNELLLLMLVFSNMRSYQLQFDHVSNATIYNHNDLKLLIYIKYKFNVIQSVDVSFCYLLITLILFEETLCNGQISFIKTK